MALRSFQTNLNTVIEKINRNNTYYFYSLRQNPNVINLAMNVSKPLVPGGNITEHTNGSDFVSEIDSNDGKIIWRSTGPSGLYNCTFNFSMVRSVLSTELKLEFREDDIYLTNWEVFVPAGSTSISGNLFLPITTGKGYSIWLKNEASAENVTIHTCELAGRPMLQIDTIPYPE